MQSYMHPIWSYAYSCELEKNLLCGLKYPYKNDIVHSPAMLGSPQQLDMKLQYELNSLSYLKWNQIKNERQSSWSTKKFLNFSVA